MHGLVNLWIAERLYIYSYDTIPIWRIVPTFFSKTPAVTTFGRGWQDVAGPSAAPPLILSSKHH